MTECSKSAAVYLLKIKSIILCVGILKICEIGLLSQFSHYQDTTVKYEASPMFETFSAVHVLLSRLSRFYQDFIKILSRFYPDFIQIFKKLTLSKFLKISG